MNTTKLITALLLTATGLTSCTQHSDSKTVSADAAAPPPPFSALRPLTDEQRNNYWYQGKAEVATYQVEQERYGEMRNGEQIMVFVTEDLSKSKQVKLDDPAAAGNDRLPVLKINALRRFKTGIYDYSLMASIFTPMDGGPTVKVTASVQDWCGQVFSQTNLQPNGAYLVETRSYFESEGDTDIELPAAMPEEELWTKVRLGTLKSGEVKVIPSPFYTRLRHKPTTVQNATLKVSDINGFVATALQYKDIPRTLTIYSEARPPHRIIGWEELENDQFMSKGSLKVARLEPYWQQNSHAFDSMRDSLMLK